MDLANVNAHTLSNDFQRVRLYSLHDSSEVIAFAPAESHGPYVILQTAVDPEDPSPDVDDFILRKDGHWLSVSLFRKLPKELQYRLFLHATAADAISVLQALPGKPAIEHKDAAGEQPGEPAFPSDDPFARAISLAHDSVVGPTPAP